MNRGRFAPTPSGKMHLGNARTALLSWLHMRALGGEFVLRMEDIDTARSRGEWAELALLDLRWLGLDWDEGPDVGGPYAPYTQSERMERYAAALERLQASGHIYPCYCSRADILASASAPHGLSSEGPSYAGTCRHLTAAERAEKARRKDPSLRFALPEGREVRFADGIAGPQVFPPGSGGDFVISRADGLYSYQLSVVVDDADMRITDVLRGSDLLDSTPRQILLYEALDLAPPAFLHVPLLNGPDGKRLAKRHGGIAISAYRERGTAPERLVGWLAYVSGLIDRPEPVKASELVRSFDLSMIPRQPVVVDVPDI
ncbi:tRNA glutamyl-Q(34) synthetase GluQRS [Saccharibacillus sp. CPCC 101409]|uniref:tRNA glutamyl-Q(34) synthetase GluQRS n=1 Tax=Saccharibacillus sp. CPCC 101409 TaxID=3058041 RepID=UPI002672B375|nr:tRNA glutamyl-Q(34) synthetase GluQRS [Saccharibacillus sp. CPCC 101409]MDO3411691.1 tRNA glutamyl-Q(34) synthetase GluQRS [Saccharibacillus sp. CPCC 101409]